MGVAHRFMGQKANAKWLKEETQRQPVPAGNHIRHEKNDKRILVIIITQSADNALFDST